MLIPSLLINTIRTSLANFLTFTVCVLLGFSRESLAAVLGQTCPVNTIMTWRLALLLLLIKF